MKVTAITAGQKKIIWSIAKKELSLNDEMLYAIIFQMFNTEQMRSLNNAQATLLISELRRKVAGLSIDKLTEPQYRKIMAMSDEFGWTPQGLCQYIEKETGVSDVKWLSVAQARSAITGLEKIRKWKKNHPVEATDGV